MQSCSLFVTVIFLITLLQEKQVLC